MVISLEEINPFERLNAPSRAKSRTNDVMSKYHLRHFGTSQRLKTNIFVNVIYKLIYLVLKIQEKIQATDESSGPNQLKRIYLGRGQHGV